MAEINFIPLEYDYFDWQGRNYARIIGRDDKGHRVLMIDLFEPHLYAILKPNLSEKQIQELIKKIEKIKIESGSRTTKIEKIKVEEKNFLGKPVKALKIYVTNFKDAHQVADKLDFPEIEARREYDLSFSTKYIIEKNLVPLGWYKVTGEILNNSQEFGGIDSQFDVDICIFAEKIEKAEEKAFKPKILAFDIEADEFELGKSEILMISLASENFKKVLTWKHCPAKQEFVECFKNEEEMLEKFVEYIKKQSPDILTGYFSDGFDLPYLRARAQKLGIKLSLGVDNSQPVFARGRIPSASISGIIHIDLFRFIETVYSQYLQSETLGLNEVASELLGEGKKDFEFKKSDKIKQHEWRDFFEYNLQDSILTLKLAEKFWPDMFEFSKILQEPLFEITRDSMSSHVENYLIHNLERYNEIAEKRPIHQEIGERQAKEKYEGAFVFQPTPGLYEDICVFDFTSMHASIIVSFNISKSTLLEGRQKNSYETPEFELDGKKEKFYFTKQKGFFPALLEEVVQKRKKYKKEYAEDKNPIKKARSNAYKLLANATYGYLGFFGARYYCREAAASTLAFVRKFTQDSMDRIKEQGYKIIFSDTDSIGFQLSGKTQKQTLDFLKKLNSELPGIMELDLEDFYKRGLFVSKRMTEAGAKKKYALIDEKGKIKIRGFETVRRDWCNLARKLQSEILELILKEGNEKKALELAKKTIINLKERKVNREQIMIRTQLKKPISEYKSITPHVIAATKMKEAGMPIDIGMSIEYFIAETRKTKKLVREKVKLSDEKGEYNIEYYLEHQILPAVENIFDVFEVNIHEISEGSRQKKLF